MGTVSPLLYVSSEFFPIVSLTCNSDQGTGVAIYFRVRLKAVIAKFDDGASP